MTTTPQFTRCPNCRTIFRVTPQQLALREGKVRCGRCRTIFNAYTTLVNYKGLRIPGPGMQVQTDTMTLRDDIDAPQEDFTIIKRPPKIPDQAPAPVRAPAPTPVSNPYMISTTPQRSDIERVATSEERRAAYQLDQQRAAARAAERMNPPTTIRYGLETYGMANPDMVKPAVAEPPAKTEPAKTEPAKKSKTKSESKAESKTTNKPETKPAANGEKASGEKANGEKATERDTGRPENARPTRRKKRRKVTVEDDLPQSSLSLVLNAHRHNWAERIGWPGWIATVCNTVLLIALLAGVIIQTTYKFSGALAFNYPELRPALELTCQALQCTVPPYRGAPAEQLIERVASELQPTAENDHELILTATLRNKTTAAVAYPDLVLEVQDLSGLPALRRYFPPSEYLPDPSVIRTGLAGGDDVVIRIRLYSQLEDASGFHLTLAYR